MDDSGQVDIHELANALKLDSVFQKKIFKMFDTDGSGHVRQICSSKVVRINPFTFIQINFYEMVLAMWDYCTLSSQTLGSFISAQFHLFRFSPYSIYFSFICFQPLRHE